MRAAVALVAGRFQLEASGGITLDTIAEIATTGVDYASSGWITHSAPNLDVALDIEIVKAVIVMDIDGPTASNGTISGVIPTEKLIDGLQKVAGRISMRPEATATRCVSPFAPTSTMWARPLRSKCVS